MRKKLSILAITLIASMMLTACGKFTCDSCGEEKSGKSYTTTMWGEKVTLCKDCYQELKELME